MNIPPEIESTLVLWRKGLAPLPQSYIDWHKQQAEAAKAQLSAFTIHREYMADDGWCDGMKVLHLIVEDNHGNLLKLKWHDSGRWFQQGRAGGWIVFMPEHYESFI